MSLKPVELQIAIPRTQDASAQQNQLLHKPAADQQLLAEQASRQAEEKLHKPNQVEAPSQAHIEEELRERDHSRRRKPGTGEEAASGNEPHNASPQPARHPYKGRHIDFSL